MSTHVESLDAGHPFLGVEARPVRGHRVAVSVAADDVVSIEGTPAQVRSLLERALTALGSVAPATVRCPTGLPCTGCRYCEVERERAEAALVPTGVVTACCELHRAEGCCDPEDCGPCCAECPACPTVGRRRLIRVVTAEYDSTGCPACAVSSQALKPATPDLVLEHVCVGGALVRFHPRSGAMLFV